MDGLLSPVDRVREGVDIEGVHDMRVGSRRLVAALRVFHDCVPGPEFRGLTREARRVTRMLGAVRDLDVLIDWFQKLERWDEEPARTGIAYLIGALRERRDKARQPMLAYLDEMIRDRFTSRLVRTIHGAQDAYRVGLDTGSIVDHELRRRTGDPTAAMPDPAREPFRSAAVRCLLERYEFLMGFAEHVPHPERMVELHDMRIAAKWLRYTMELFAPAYADSLKQPLGVIKQYQELLGDLHDADVRLDEIRLALTHVLRPGPVEQLGWDRLELIKPGLRVVLAQETVTRAKCYRAFAMEWRRQEKREFSSRLRERLQKPRAA